MDEVREDILTDVLEHGAKGDLFPYHDHVGHADPGVQRGGASSHVRPIGTQEEQPNLVQFLGLDVLQVLELKPQVRSLRKSRVHAFIPVLPIGSLRVLEHEHVERPTDG